MKIAVFSGSFDPVHNGHIKVAEKALDYVGIVAFIAEPKPNSKQNVTDLRHREAMLKLVVKKNKNFLLLNNIHDQHHTLESLREILKSDSQLNEATVYWLMGQDTFERVENWDNANDFESELFLVASRNQKGVGSIDIKKSPYEYIEINVRSKVSSSKIRAGDYSELSESVKEYIVTNNLYTDS